MLLLVLLLLLLLGITTKPVLEVRSSQFVQLVLSQKESDELKHMNANVCLLENDSFVTIAIVTQAAFYY